MSFLAKRVVGSNAFRATPTISSFRQFSSTAPAAMSTLAEVKQNFRKVMRISQDDSMFKTRKLTTPI